MGTPQGSTASPYFWNVIADELHEEIDKLEDVDSEGFADDTVFIASGKDSHYVQFAMQKALKVAEEWASRHGLHFAPSKTVVMLFTRKIKYEQPAQLEMNGVSIPYSTEHKHLGIYLNSQLDWKYHLEYETEGGQKRHLQARFHHGKNNWSIPCYGPVAVQGGH